MSEAHCSNDMSEWRGRVDAIDGDAGRRWHQVVRPVTAAGDTRGVALLGLACDADAQRNHDRVGVVSGDRSRLRG